MALHSFFPGGCRHPLFFVPGSRSALCF
ncbi:MAG TPA: hypothetical protein DER60_08195 [Syntrophomonas sp.]|nr:hypothetical protein [Syntrophomonas sp.]